MQRVIKRVTTIEETILVDEPAALSERDAGVAPSSSDTDRKVEDLSDDQGDAEDNKLEGGDPDRRHCPPCSARR